MIYQRLHSYLHILSDFEEAQRSRETSSAIEQSSQNETELDDSSQISSMEESCGYGEKSDGGAIPNNVNYPVENTAKDKRFTGIVMSTFSLFNNQYLGGP